ncbi:C40 family peptidase [Tenacibaculum sp. 190524A02b]|uniref:C40 family peptidase n=1 Tax=Tenacibaculum vairaonense TaxID=3137860 RepID=UPI0032B2A3CE
MKRQLLLLLCIIIFIINRFLNTGKERIIKPVPQNSLVTKVISIAKNYQGVPYRAGGTTSQGMDCSGLVQTSFKKIDVPLPRSSQSMSNEGQNILLENIKEGDLLFFNINRLKGKINHVGLVTSVKNNSIIFIHSTTSKGVITNSLDDNYWKKAFVKARRVLK